MRRLLGLTMLLAPIMGFASLENVALGKKVEFLPVQPNYRACSDPDDAKQLTDGEYVTGPGQMWIHKGCVGWNNSMGKSYAVKLDLGADTPISGFSWDVASGCASVAFPQSVLVYVSLDGENWAFAGDLLGKALTLRAMPAPGTYSVYRAWTDDLPCHGRWVMFVVQQTLYTFVDEVEVYRGKDELLKEPFPETTVTDPIKSGGTVRFRLRMMRDAKRSGAAKDASIRKRIDALDLEALPKDFKTILPLNDLHAEIYAANAENLRAAGFAKPVFWTNNRWANLDPLTVPPATSVSDEPIRIRTMRGEVRSAAVNILNPTDRPLDCRVSVEGLPDGTDIELSEVLYTDTSWFRSISGALKAGKGNVVEFMLPAGISKQVWIRSVRPKGAAGLRTGVVRARLSDGTELTHPLTVNVYDLDYPVRPRLQVGGWDYLNNPNYYRNPGATESKVALHRDMGVNVEWATGGVRPTGATFDAAGHLVSKPDFSEWDRWTQTVVPGFQTYAVFLALEKSFEGEPLGTERFKTMAKEYFAAWGAHVRATMRPGQRVLIQVVDEPRNAEQADVAIHWMRAVKSAGCPELVTYMDPLFPDGFDAKIDPAFWDLCDIVCPQSIDAAKAAEFRRKGQEVFLYSCIGPSRTFDPQSYYRLSAWRVFNLGGTGMLYWAFGCGGGIGDSWRAYAQPGTEYSPYFVGPDAATPAKQSEAIRESIEDFEYLSMLAERRGAEKARKAVRHVLDNYPKGDPDWDNPALTDEKRNLMDSVCMAILRELSKDAGKRKMLAIGDSITAARVWQKRAGELLGMDVRSHCKGGVGALGMVDGDGVAPPAYDPDDFGVKKLYNLSVRDVADVDLIFLMGFYNEVGSISDEKSRGVATDLYPRENTFCGRVNYVIRRVRETLAEAKNDRARIVLVSPHRYGTNCWVDRTSYGTGDFWLSALSSVAKQNGIKFIDLMNGGGVGRENWDRYQRSPTALDARYLPADGAPNAGTNCPFASLAAAPDPAANKGRLITVSGVPGHYASDGREWKKSSAPFPWFADQLHLNADGYRLLGEAVAREMK